MNKNPTWVYIIGIIMILAGGCGEMNSLTGAFENHDNVDIDSINQELALAFDSIEVQQTNTSEEIDSSNLEKSEEMISSVKDVMKISPYSLLWSKRFNLIGIPLNLLYLLAGILLLVKGPSFGRYTLIMLVISILFSLVRYFVMSGDPDPGIINYAIYIMLIPSLIVDICLGVINFLGNRRYKEELMVEN